MVSRGQEAVSRQIASRKSTRNRFAAGRAIVVARRRRRWKAKRSLEAGERLGDALNGEGTARERRVSMGACSWPKVRYPQGVFAAELCRSDPHNCCFTRDIMHLNVQPLPANSARPCGARNGPLRRAERMTRKLGVAKKKERTRTLNLCGHETAVYLIFRVIAGLRSRNVRRRVVRG